MFWCTENLRNVTCFHNLAAIHYRHAIRDIGNHTDIVGNDDDS